MVFSLGRDGGVNDGGEDIGLVVITGLFITAAGVLEDIPWSVLDGRLDGVRDEIVD